MPKAFKLELTLLGFFGVNWIVRVFVSCIFFVHVILLAKCGSLQSPTCNELGHLVAGVSNLTLGRFDLYRVNPPLVRSVAAFPLVISGVRTDWKQYSNDPFARPEWLVGEDFFAANTKNALTLLIIARWACIPFSLLGAITCYSWGKSLYGRAGGLISSVLWCFCPFVLGHGSLITTDVACASCGLAACYTFWHYLKCPTWTWALLTGIVLGIAELSKTTLLVLYPIFAITWLFWKKRRSDVATLKDSLKLFFVFLSSMYIINIGYLFDGSFQRSGQYRFQSSLLSGNSPQQQLLIQGNRFENTLLAGIPIPLPRDYVQGIDTQLADIEFGRPSYLLGQWSTKGWWYYYVISLGIKLPLGTLVLLVLASICGNTRPNRMQVSRDELVIKFPLFIMFCFVSSQTGFSAHSRYIIPVVPFLYIWIGRVACIATGKTKKFFSVIVTGLLIWSSMSSLTVFPHNLSYFNELAGGPLGGPSYLLGSNVDWGQDLLFLKKWLDENPQARPFSLAYYGYISPTRLDLNWPMPPRGGEKYNTHNLQPGWYAVSVNCLYGDAMESSRDSFTYFRRIRPIAYAGYSIYIYKIGE